MSDVRVLHADSVAPTRWKNGGGFARELMRSHPGEDWQWRVSLADIESNGPFSAYLGVQRHFAVVSGAGVTLHFAAFECELDTGDEVLAFDGADTPMCSLIDGPTRDLNLMLRGCRGTMRRALSGQAWHEAWPLRGRFDIDTLTLHWGLPAAGPLHANGPALWIGIDA
jgi:uncharacterized protein